MKKQKNFNLSTELIDAIGKESLKLGINTSEYAERAFRAYLEQPEMPEPEDAPIMIVGEQSACFEDDEPLPNALDCPKCGNVPCERHREVDVTPTPYDEIGVVSHACAVCMGMGVFHAQRGKMEHCENCGGTGRV